MVTKKPEKDNKAKKTELKKSPQEFLASFLRPEDTIFIEEHKKDFIKQLKDVAIGTPPGFRNKIQKTSICLGTFVLEEEPNYDYFKIRIDIQEAILEELKQDWGLIEDFTITDNLKSILENNNMPPEEMLWAVITFYPNKFLTNIKDSTTLPTKQDTTEIYYNPKNGSLFLNGKFYKPRKETQAKLIRNLFMRHQVENDGGKILKPGKMVLEDMLAAEVGTDIKKLRELKKQLNRTFKETFASRLKIDSNSKGVLLVLTK